MALKHKGLLSLQVGPFVTCLTVQHYWYNCIILDLGQWRGHDDGVVTLCCDKLPGPLHFRYVFFSWERYDLFWFVWFIDLLSRCSSELNELLLKIKYVNAALVKEQKCSCINCSALCSALEQCIRNLKFTIKQYVTSVSIIMQFGYKWAELAELKRVIIKISQPKRNAVDLTITATNTKLSSLLIPVRSDIY